MYNYSDINGKGRLKAGRDDKQMLAFEMLKSYLWL